MLQRLLHGDDIFISYSRADGSLYAAGLADELTRRGYSCFLDQLGTDPDVNLPASLTRKIKACTVCVLIGTERARVSKAVAKEIEEFKTTKRTIIPVCFMNAPGDEPLYSLIPGLARATETPETLATGEPSPEVISRVEKSFNYTRRNKRLGRMAAAAAALLLLLLAGAVAAGAYARSKLAEAQQARKEAERQKVLTASAAEDARAARTLADEQKALAERESARATEQSQIAERSKTEADKQQRLARAKAEEARKQTEIASAKAEEARVQTERARAEQLKADVQAVVASARSRLSIDPEQSVLLALDAEERLRAAGVQRLPQLDETLRVALASSHVRALLAGKPGRSISEERARLLEDRALDVSFSDDGRLVATSLSMTGTRVWDVQTGELKAEVKGGYKRLTFGPGGKLLYMMPETGDVGLYVWDWERPEVDKENPRPFADPETHKVVATYLRGALSFGAGGRMLTPSEEDVVVLRDMRDGRALASFPHRGAVTGTGFSPDGKLFYTLSRDPDLKAGVVVNVWGVDGRHVALLTVGRTESPLGLTSGGRLVTGGGFARLGLWDVAKGEKVATLAGDTGVILDINFTLDGRRVVTASDDKTARVWDTETGALVAELRGHDGPVTSAAFSPDGRFVMTASHDGTTRIWDTTTARTVLELRGQVGPIVKAEFAPSGGERIATLSYDGTGRIWDTEVARRPVTEIKYADNFHGSRARLAWVSFGPEGRSVTTVDYLNGVQRWELGTGKYLGGRRTSSLTFIALSEDQRLTLVSGEDVTKVLDTATGLEVSTLASKELGFYGRFDARGKRLVTWGDGHASVWDVKTGARLQKIKAGGEKSSSASIRAAAFSRDEKLLALATSEMVGLWDTRTWENAGRLSPEGCKTGRLTLALSPDSRMVAVGCDKHVEVWSVGGERLKTFVPDGTDGVWHVAFSHDGTLLALADAGGFAQVWGTKDWRSVNVFRAVSGPVYSLDFAPDDSMLLIACGDGFIRIYPREMFMPYEDLLKLVPQRVTRRELTWDERSRYLPRPLER